MKIGSMKTKSVFIVAFLTLLSANVFAQKQSAVGFVESFYKFHRARSGIFNSGELRVHKKWFTAELNQLFQNELKREKEYLKLYPTNKPYFGDGFPFTPYEECYKDGKEIKNTLRILPISIRKELAVVEAKFYYPKKCGGEFITNYKIELAKTKTGWLIKDFIYSGESRLTNDLRRPEY